MEFVIDLTFPPDEHPPAPMEPRAAEEEKRRMDVIYARAGQRDRLDGADLQNEVSFQVAVEDVQGRRDYFRTTPVEKTIQGQMIGPVSTILGMEPAIKTVLNIGIRYGFVDHVLATRFPHIQFVGVDFMPNLVEMNAEFSRPNLELVPGYALDLLESGRVSADLVTFSSTGSPISNPELRRYMRTLAPRCRYIVMNEPVLHDRQGRSIDPLKLPLDRSQPVRLGNAAQPNPALISVHNYKAIVENAGFHVLHYKVSPFPPFEDFLLQLVARSSLFGVSY